MATSESVTSAESTVAYTSVAEVQKHLPSVLTEETSLPGKPNIEDATEMILEFSRIVDGYLWAAGFKTPFPAYGATTGPAPRSLSRIVQHFVVGELRTIMKHGNRKTTTADAYRDEAQKLLDDIIEKPGRLGPFIVSAPEVFTNQVSAGHPGGQMGSMVYYRLLGHPVVPDSLRFVNSGGQEVFRTDSLPFDHGRDWAWVDPAEGVFILLDQTTILSAMGAGGGAIYQCTYRRPGYGKTHAPWLRGV